MASSRRTGTNESISTYAASGADYSSLATWETATDNDNVTGTVSPVLECVADQYDDGVTMSAATNDSTYFRIIRPNSSSHHSGVRDTGVRFYRTTDASVITLADLNEQIQDLCLRITANSVATRGTGFSQAGAGESAFVGCIATNSQNAGAGVYNGLANPSTTGRVFFINCISENVEGIGFNANNTAGVEIVLYNCTVIGGTTGFSFGAGATTTARNCLGHGTSSADFSGTLDTGSNNASEDATALGTSPRTSQTFTFINAGANDYHLAISDAGARGFGTSLAADGTYAFDDDIDRKTITGATWDIGFDRSMPLKVWDGQSLSTTKTFNGLAKASTKVYDGLVA